MTTKRTLINRMYKISRELLNGFHNDDAWQDLHAVFNNLIKNGYNVIIENTEYDGLKSKTYWFFVDNLEHIVKGHIVCSFCGTVDNPMSRYDMSMILY